MIGNKKSWTEENIADRLNFYPLHRIIKKHGVVDIIPRNIK